MLVLAPETLFQSRLLGNEDVDLEFFVITGRRFGLLLTTALVLIVVASLLIDKSLASKEVRDKASLLHHVFGNWANDANHTRKQALNRIVLEKHISSEEFGKNTA